MRRNKRRENFLEMQRSVKKARCRRLASQPAGQSLWATGRFLLVAALWSAIPMNLLWGQWTQEELSSGSGQMIGQVAPAWVHRGWVNSEPLDVEQLKGKVILLRFFSDQPIGVAAVRELYGTYQTQGLAAVGIYVPEPMPTETDPAHVRRLAAALGFEFPVGVDSRWETVHKYWLNRADAEPWATTFLIDRQGVIRYIQPDGRYDKNARDRRARGEYEKLEKQIQTLLKEAPKAPGNAGVK